MMDLWYDLPVAAQDLLAVIGLLLPALITGVVVLRGHTPWPLVKAIIWRFRVPSVMFIVLIAVSVGLGVGLLAQERGLRKGTAQAADKFDLIVSAPGSELSVMLAAVFLQPSDMGLIDGETYNEIAATESVAIAAPLAFGDSYAGAPVIGSTAEFVAYLTDQNVEGAIFADHEEAVVGALVPLEIGAQFTPAHGMTHIDGGAEEHGVSFSVTGRMAPTGTPWDRAIIVPVEAVWEVHGLANGHAPEAGDVIGGPFDAEYFPGTPAVVVHAEALWANYALRSTFTRDRETMAFFPGAVLAGLYNVMGDVRQAMSVMALVTQVLVAVSVMLGLFILSRLFRRQVALLRALGAPSRFVFAMMWSFSAVLLLSGAITGMLIGVGAAMVLSQIVTAQTNILVTAPLGWQEIQFVAGFVSVTLLISLLPAAVVLRQPVVEGLRA
ncbi:FtsX-like permease family protein [Marivivens donghaensis]|uniref:FtsX-like permease family protein n=1 Tax=Marivivens donghaensis TaxID=1699413 RepID=A0ABX0W1K1_9RHOB|nr:FtsX-like permease family protein [Marivivens donghaensis]NIY73999.1 FtsX-like permease family protein [Marivivens donghaensis]